jgi:hypothetical protein
MNFFKKLFGSSNTSIPKEKIKENKIPFDENTLTPHEIEICGQLNYEHTDALFLKKIGGHEIEKFIFENNQSDTEPPICIFCYCDESNAISAVENFQESLREKNKFLFIGNLVGKQKLVLSNYTNDPYKIMEFADTNGINYELDSLAVISRIKQWDARYGITFFKIDFDALLLKIKRPELIDTDSLAIEINEFCPDAEDIDNIKKDLKKGIIELWWD